MAIKELWVDKYQPTTLDSYVFRDAAQTEIVEKWISEKSIPHILLTGSPGVGKSSLATLLINLLEVNPLDVMEINASRLSNVDIAREKIYNFIQMMPFGEFKIVFLDEFDGFSVAAQNILRGTIEEFQSSARFILTANYPNKIIPAIRSRFQGFHVDKVDINEFTARAAVVLLGENIQFDIEVLDTHVSANYPDLRSCIHDLEQHSVDGKLMPKGVSDVKSTDYLIKMVEMFEAGKISDARKLLCANIRPDDVEDIFRWLYDHIDLFGDTERIQNDAILIIRDGLVNHTLISDPEINLSAVLIQLMKNKQSR